MCAVGLEGGPSKKQGKRMYVRGPQNAQFGERLEGRYGVGGNLTCSHMGRMSVDVAGLLTTR